LQAASVSIWGRWPKASGQKRSLVLTETLKESTEPYHIVETRPMSRITGIFEEVHEEGSPARRIVLTPDF